jgi:hypothetical protein
VLPNGEKNAIRKTYKGHIKRLGLNGHFDVVKTDPDSPDGFLAMMRFPQEEWYVHHVQNKEIENGLSGDIRQRMGRAVTMAKGVVPKSVWDSSVLGELGPLGLARAEKHKSTAPNTPVPNYGAPTAGAQQARSKQQQTLAPQGGVRPQRNVKKRSYGDSSFEGYGEGFHDDGDTGYSTGEGDGPGLKRRKKVLTERFMALTEKLMANLLQIEQHRQSVPATPTELRPGHGRSMTTARRYYVRVIMAGNTVRYDNEDWCPSSGNPFLPS